MYKGGVILMTLYYLAHSVLTVVDQGARKHTEYHHPTRAHVHLTTEVMFSSVSNPCGKPVSQ